MAAPVDGNAAQRRSIWPRAPLGVGGKLQFAFSVVAGLTAISTAVSLVCFSAVELGLGDFAARQMPIVADVIELSAIIDQRENRRGSKADRRIDRAQAWRTR